MNQLKTVLTEHDNKILMAVFENDQIAEMSAFGKDELSLGSVFLCRVTRTLPGIKGAFIQYKNGCNGFIKSEKYKQEMIVPLQLKKEASGEKEPLFTDDITLTSKYAVIKKGLPSVNISGKLDKNLAQPYRQNFMRLADERGLSIVIRTNASLASYDEIESDIIVLSDRLSKIYDDAKTRTLYSCLYRPDAPYIVAVRDLKGVNNEIVTDIPAVYDELCSASGFCGDNIRLYNDEMISLFHLNRLGHYLETATNRIVNLKSGASIFIEQTEALCSIDVNTHKSNVGKDIEQTFFNTNIEAAREIMKQLRLRNISGMIIIDFINMKQESHYKELFMLLKELALNDPVKTTIIDITGLKLVEIVRTKKRRSLREQIRN